MTEKESKVKTSFEGVLAVLTYKPGWKMSIEEYATLDGKIILALNFKVDATCVDSGEPITIDRSFVIPQAFQIGNIDAGISQTRIMFWITKRIRMIEEHEYAEWLKFKGERWIPEVHDEDGYEAEKDN